MKSSCRTPENGSYADTAKLVAFPQELASQRKQDMEEGRERRLDLIGGLGKVIQAIYFGRSWARVDVMSEVVRYEENGSDLPCGI